MLVIGANQLAKRVKAVDLADRRTRERWFEDSAKAFRSPWPETILQVPEVCLEAVAGKGEKVRS